jgi:hypothetical protein
MPYFRYYWCLSKIFAIVPQLSANVVYGDNSSYSYIHTCTNNRYQNVTKISTAMATRDGVDMGVNITHLRFVFWPDPQYGVEFSYVPVSVGYNGKMSYSKSWDFVGKNGCFWI